MNEQRKDKYSAQDLLRIGYVDALIEWIEREHPGHSLDARACLLDIRTALDRGDRSIKGIPYPVALPDTQQRIPDGKYTVIRTGVLEYLLGTAQHPDTGAWFGDGEYAHSARFWWRKELREATIFNAAPQVPESVRTGGKPEQPAQDPPTGPAIVNEPAGAAPVALSAKPLFKAVGYMHKGRVMFEPGLEPESDALLYVALSATQERKGQ